MRTALSSVAILLALAMRSGLAPAAPGDLDPTFGDGGFVRDPMPDST